MHILCDGNIANFDTVMRTPWIISHRELMMKRFEKYLMRPKK